MRQINVPSYNSLLLRDRQIRSIQELYEFLCDLKGEVEESITSDKPFKETWRTDGTLAQFCEDVIADEDAVVGQVFMGELECSGLPAGMSNGEAVVQVNKGLNDDKLLVITVTSTNLAPYHWEQSYYDGNLYGWKSWKEPMSINVSSSAPASITAEANTYYRIDAAVGTMDVTLPAITGATTVSTIVFGFTTDTTTAVTFSSAATGAGSPYAPTLEASKDYEVSCLWNGASWNIACAEINKV